MNTEKQQCTADAFTDKWKDIEHEKGKSQPFRTEQLWILTKTQEQYG